MSIVRWFVVFPAVVLAEKSLHRSPRYREWLFTEKIHQEKPFRIAVIFQHLTSEWEPQYVFTPPQSLFVFRCNLHDLFHHSICERNNTLHTTRETNSTRLKTKRVALWVFRMETTTTATHGDEQKIGAPLQWCSRVHLLQLLAETVLLSKFIM